MKKIALVSSILANLLLAVLLISTRNDHQRESLALVEMLWRAEDRHLGIHGMSVSALESREPREIEEVTALLQTLIANEEEQRENRERIRKSLASGEGEWVGPGFDR